MTRAQKRYSPFLIQFVKNCGCVSRVATLAGRGGHLLCSRGFSFIELLIVIAIIGILVLTALPSYQSYTRRAHYTELVQAAAPFKLGVESCFQWLNALEGCVGGKNGVPENRVDANEQHLLATIETDKGIITLAPKNKFGITTQDTYRLTPSVNAGQLDWATSGGGVSAGYAH